MEDPYIIRDRSGQNPTGGCFGQPDPGNYLEDPKKNQRTHKPTPAKSKILSIYIGNNGGFNFKSNQIFLHFFTPKCLPYPPHQKSLVNGSSTSVKYICEIVNYDHEIGIGLFFQNIFCLYVFLWIHSEQ